MSPTQSNELLFSRFLARAATEPARPAVIGPGGELSYRELLQRSAVLGARLRELGARPNQLIAVALEKGWEQVVAVVGVLQSGAAYLPIDPGLPRDRVWELLADGEVELVVAGGRRGGTPSWPDGVTAVPVEQPFSGSSAVGPTDPVQGATDLAYVIYTSGSTGRPKGVMIDHRSAVNTIADINRRFEVGPEDRVLALSALGFDLSVYDLFGTLAAGGAVVMPAPGSRREPAHWLELVERYGVTIWNSVPTLMRMLVEHLEASGGRLGEPLRLALLSGDWIPVGLPGRIQQLGRQVRVISLGGATEGAIWSILYPVGEIDEARTRIPYGHAMANQEVTVRDELLRVCPPEVRGELCIGGAGVARGYWRDPRRTAERFVPDPESGGRLYRTGDYGFSHPDGLVEILGRMDQQVKIHGHRVELGEIEATLIRRPEVRTAVVLAPHSPVGERFLVAFVVPEVAGGVDIDAVRDFLTGKLPSYMLPSRFVLLDELPLTPSGKPDRKALAEIQPQPRQPAPDDAPRGLTERVIREIWTEVLGSEPIGAREDFFRLGGRSLQAAQVVARLRQRLGVDLPVGSLFEHPTVAALARKVEATSRTAGGGEKLSGAPRVGPAPLSFSQERVWFLEHLGDTGGAYQFQATLRLRGDLDVGALERSLDEIVRRHEILRTSFPVLEDGPVQRVHPPPRLELPVEDTRPEQLEELIDREIAKRFDTTRLPLVRWRLLRLSPREHVLIHVEHHLLHDGWSFTLLVRELAELYEAFVRGESSPLAEPPLQFRDFAVHQRGWMTGEGAAAQLAYWREKLAGPPPLLALPLDRSRPPAQTFHGDSLRMALAASACQALQAVDAGARTTPFMRMLTVFLILLYRYADQTDVSVGTGIANRRWPETEGMLGMFLNNIVLRADLAGHPSFLELLDRVRRVVLEAFAHQDIPFDRVVKAVRPPRDASRNPLFQVMFSFHDSPLPPLALPELSVEVREALSNRSAKFDLNVIAIPNTSDRAGEGAEGGMTLVWEYNTDLLDGATVRRMANHYRELLASAVETPEAPISRLAMMTEAERRRTLVGFDASQTDYPRDACLHDLLEAQASQRPEAIAVVAGDRRMAFGELDREANRLARHLRRLGVGPEVGVALCLERSLDQIVALAAILKAGGYYVPLDPDLPARRFEFVLEDSGSTLVVTRQPNADRFGSVRAATLLLDRDARRIAEESDERLGPAAVAENLAYVLYTSGSTGRPKGVAVTHRNVMRLVRGVDYATFGPDETFLQLAPLSFDASTFEIWGSLLTGARLVLGPPQAPSLDDLAKLIAEHAITTLWLTAGLFHQMVEQNLEGLAGLGQLLAGGDVLQLPAVRRASRRLPDVRLVNGYGPTEATTFSCCHRITDADSLARSVPIGRPIGNASAYVLTPDLEPVPTGVPGEIFVGGDGVARGYVGRPRLTAERFIPDPFGHRPGGRIYRTGDRARYLGDGNLEFLGRLDRQIKVRGFRIEPGEIEAALLEHRAVGAAAVAIDSSRSAEDRLVAWIEPAAASGPVEIGELRRHLRSILPSHMIPAYFVQLASLPLTPNGKIDFASLPPPDRRRPELGTPARAPTTAVEGTVARIWERLLEARGVGVTDDFFELGGDSLLVTRMVSRLRDELGVELPMIRVFETPTIRDLAAAIEELEPESGRRALRPASGQERESASAATGDDRRPE